MDGRPNGMGKNRSEQGLMMNTLLAGEINNEKHY